MTFKEWMEYHHGETQSEIRDRLLDEGFTKTEVKQELVAVRSEYRKYCEKNGVTARGIYTIEV